MESVETLTEAGTAAPFPIPDLKPVSGRIEEARLLVDDAEEPSRKSERRLRDQAGALLDAVKIWPPALVSSLLGPPWTWIPPYERYSELKILDLWRLRRTIRFLVNTNIPSLPMTPPAFGPPLIENLFWHPTLVLQRPDHHGSFTSFPDEHWFFINGVLTDDNVAQINAAYLAYLFHRPITLIQNSTDALLIDLLQCFLGRAWHHPTEPLRVAFPAIYDALVNPHKRRVVVVCHSQGAIVMANVLRWLRRAITQNEEGPSALETGAPTADRAGPEPVYPDDVPLDIEEFDRITRQDLDKLEVYAFATCAQTFLHPGPKDSPMPPPWIEHFGNENDVVARLGMLAPRPAEWGIRIQGLRYVAPGRWGHLLNAHYLTPIRNWQKHGHRRGGRGTSKPFKLVNGDEDGGAAQPRLFAYINGGSPDLDTTSGAAPMDR